MAIKRTVEWLNKYGQLESEKCIKLDPFGEHIKYLLCNVEIKVRNGRSFTTYEYVQHCKSISHEETLHKPSEIGPSQTKIRQFYPASFPELSKFEGLPSPEIDLNVIVETAINRPKPCDGIFNESRTDNLFQHLWYYGYYGN